jgi:hypothetical protein
VLRVDATGHGACRPAPLTRGKAETSVSSLSSARRPEWDLMAEKCWAEKWNKEFFCPTAFCLHCKGKTIGGVWFWQGQVRISEFGFTQPGMSADAFGSDWAQWLTLSQPSTLIPQPTGAPLNQERRFIPRYGLSRTELDAALIPRRFDKD